MVTPKLFADTQQIAASIRIADTQQFLPATMGERGRRDAIECRINLADNQQATEHIDAVHPLHGQTSRTPNNREMHKQLKIGQLQQIESDTQRIARKLGARVTGWKVGKVKPPAAGLNVESGTR